ncbi:hypothetical protein PCNPT3_05500 [Psychromonas sp. CNPT3]|uniref:hypothetical protein n=1 Tax=Psychromonas sp. CNPT3 TaxID=314282 RepID=UPI00006E3F83|nr:hypothetical protein [Psychromonas sp. CNPT3]AGH81042.1 hypothetical protein PCNPT3_05500 [Psychromonas sp. CNPT3]
MNIILVADIFGKTPALIALSDALGASNILDPYAGVNMDFKSEAEAYSYFMAHVGLDVYFSKLVKITASLTSPSVLVGFSVGASLIWRLSERLSLNNIHVGICYYGSQIRHYKEINPAFNIELIFPEKEIHFDVLKLQKILSLKPKVKIIKVNYLHGFMNTHSINYHHFAYIKQLNWLRAKNIN